jgi:hypothetical protein
LRKQEDRGVWRYDGEIDLGYGAAFHTARTIVIWDSVFGLHAYGGKLENSNSTLSIVPRDGVRQQFSYIMNDHRFHLTLGRDGFLKDSPLLISSEGKKFIFVLENRAKGEQLNKASEVAHTTILQIRSENMIPRRVTVKGKSVSIKVSTTGWEVHIPVQKDKENVIIEWK